MIRKLLTVASLCGIAGASHALTVYDNFGNWDGNVTNGWLAQSQKFPVPNVDNVLMLWKSEFSDAMSGMPVNFRIYDDVGGVPGGNVYFNQNAVVPNGGGIIQFSNMNVALVSGNLYHAVWDFLGYSGQSIHFTSQDVVPGNGLWWSGSWSDFPSLDQKLRAEFVPEPATLAALGAGLALLRARRRK